MLRFFVMVLQGCLGATMFAPQAFAQGNSAICDLAAYDAAQLTGVPVAILRAVTLAETGRKIKSQNELRPWPWAVHTNGRGHWFADQATALSFIEQQIKDGSKNIDVGCFQLNIRWHSQNFRSLDEMITPKKNALYAARFLLQHYAETKSWRAAVGRYHSRTQALADIYVKRLEALFTQHLRPTLSAASQAEPTPQPVILKTPQHLLGGARSPLIAMTGLQRPLFGASQ